jgi:putative flippase GtrA
MFDWLQSLLSFRFLKFCTVGASGVVVNLLFLALFSDILSFQVNIASAMAIELSINSNFFMNEIWTFRDRHVSSGRARRWAKFHLVSLAGGGIQWVVFIGCNLFLAMMVLTDGSNSALGEEASALERYLIRPIANPPDVGYWKYLSQLIGIGAATFWNYIVNFYWTWARSEEVVDG